MKKTKQTKWQDYGGRFNIAGVQYSDYQQLPASVKAGEKLVLVGERNNTFDNKAIRIECRGIKIGYIPAHTAIQAGLWSEHEKGSKCIGILTAINRTNPTWYMFTVQIKVARRVLTKREGEVLFNEMRADLSYR